ncbi:uncharacterized protein LOC125658294 [Ostrea edulis]|uniref:uncharacterized protein LOC125658294 n=1 Tax=Ostrea edulis TaxID=37623 RepID=UPI0024AF4BBA|nr:uncharacterized protein LOC125658294 [Ostrea edulis]
MIVMRTLADVQFWYISYGLQGVCIQSVHIGDLLKIEMKIAIVLVLCLAAGSQASFLDDLKNAFSNVGSALTTTVHAVGDQAKVVGQNLLSTAAEQGKQLASQALQSLLMGTMNALSSPSTTDSTKRSLSELLQQAKPLTDAAKQVVEQKMDNLNGVYTEALNQLKALSSQLTHLPASEIMQKVDQVVAAHHSVANKLQAELVSELTQIFGKALALHPGAKRNGFTDALGQVGQSLSSFFQPHVQALQQLVGGVGDTVKQTANAFHTALTTGAHGQAVSQSSAALVQHGQNALSALKDAVTDVLQQTLTNMQPHLVNLLSHGAQALTETLTHTSGTNAEVPANPQ